MNIETIIAIIAAVGGLSGLVSAISTAVFKLLEYKKAQKGETLEAKLDEKMKPILETSRLLKEQNEELKAELKEIRLDTTRLQLLDLVHDEPENTDTILKVAHRYLFELAGNWWVASELERWAKKHDVEVPANIWSVIEKEREK